MPIDHETRKIDEQLAILEIEAKNETLEGLDKKIAEYELMAFNAEHEKTTGAWKRGVLNRNLSHELADRLGTSDDKAVTGKNIFEITPEDKNTHYALISLGLSME
jgi:hypothetical protein